MAYAQASEWRAARARSRGAPGGLPGPPPEASMRPPQVEEERA
jgi:hypothetical protein